MNIKFFTERKLLSYSAYDKGKHRSVMSLAKSAGNLFYKITQLRSTIGVAPRVRDNMKILGLKRRNHVIYQRVSPSTAHRLNIVKELVKIELVDHRKTPEELAMDRKYKPGFQLLKHDMLQGNHE